MLGRYSIEAVPLGSSNVTSAATPAVPDTTSPVMSGSLTVTNVATTTLTLTWQPATDNTGVAGYEYSKDGGSTYTSVGNVLTTPVTGLTSSTTYHLAVRAFDAAGNKSVALTSSTTTASIPDTVAPTMNGAIAVGTITQASVSFSWQAASDNTGVTGYEVSSDGGTSYTDAGSTLSANLTGLSASTTYAIRVRAYDTAGNKSTALATSVTTMAVPVVPDTTPPQMPGSVLVTLQTQSSFMLSWQSATDSVGVTGYEYSINNGATYTPVGNSLNVVVSGLSVGATYQVKVRAYDSAGNRSTPLSVTAMTTSAPSTPASFIPSVARTISIQPTAPIFTGSKFWNLTDPKKPRGIKDPQSTIDITFDWTAWLTDIGSPGIATTTFILDGVQDEGDYTSGNKTTVFVSGLTGTQASITCRIVTASTPARTDERTVYLDLENQ